MAGSINRAIIIGRLGQDPKLTYMPNGNPVVEMSVATDESFKNREGQKEERTEWHRVKVFGKQAEFCSNYLSKGRLVYVEGSIRTRSWEDQQGQKRYATEIVVSAPGNTVNALDRGDQQEQPQNAPGQRPAPQGDHGQGAGRQDAPRGGYGQRGGQDQAGFPTDVGGMDDVPF